MLSRWERRPRRRWPASGRRTPSPIVPCPLISPFTSKSLLASSASHWGTSGLWYTTALAPEAPLGGRAARSHCHFRQRTGRPSTLHCEQSELCGGITASPVELMTLTVFIRGTVPPALRLGVLGPGSVLWKGSCLRGGRLRGTARPAAELAVLGGGGRRPTRGSRVPSSERRLLLWGHLRHFSRFSRLSVSLDAQTLPLCS